MKSLRCGEQIKEMNFIKTKYGICILYFTNFVITIESITRGLILELEYRSIIKFYSIDRKLLKLIWVENDSTYDLIVNHERPEYLIRRFNEIKNEHMNLLKIFSTDKQNIRYLDNNIKILNEEQKEEHALLSKNKQNNIV